MATEREEQLKVSVEGQDTKVVLALIRQHVQERAKESEAMADDFLVESDRETMQKYNGAMEAFQEVDRLLSTLLAFIKGGVT